MSVANANARGACALVSALAEQAAHAVISPGSRNTPVALALHAAASIETHVVLDERTAGFFALGLARATGKPVILSCTSGSAGAHYLPAIIEAFEGLAPLVAITADRPPELHGHAAPQTTRQTELFGSHVLSRYDLPLPDTASDNEFYSLGSRALSIAVGGPGPVHLNAPFREPLWAENTSYSVRGPSPSASVKPAGDSKSRRAVEQALAGIQRGLVIVGARARQDRLDGDFEFARNCHQLANAIGWPILTDVTSGARHSPVESPGHITGFDALLRSETFAQTTPDRVLLIGRPPTSKVLNRWLSRERVPAVVLSHRPDRRDPTIELAQGVAADPTAALTGWSVEQAADTDWFSHWTRGENAFSAALKNLEPDWEGPIARTVAHAMPDGGLLHLASSMPIRDVDGFCGPLPRPVTVVANRGVNGIDGLIATAAGQSMGWSRGPVTLLIGDLAFLHDLGSLRDAAARQMSLTVVVVNNGGGHIFDFLPISKHPDAFERYFLTPQNPNLADLARACGARHSKAESTPALRDAVLTANERPGVDVIEVIVDGTRNRPRHEDFYRRLHGELS
ncbi:MAG: 2-succinyl-5-enolpyruvyl-6-hydroxy-3-cyclohexene-1-carboxylic-acid synthase [Myxococcota bacterium]